MAYSQIKDKFKLHTLHKVISPTSPSAKIKIIHRYRNTSYHKDHRSLDGIYWFGLHAADRNLTDLYLWADCAEADYMAPAVFGYPMTDYQCVKMWIRRQVFLGAYKDMWLKGVMCNETHPFICTWNATGWSIYNSDLVFRFLLVKFY